MLLGPFREVLAVVEVYRVILYEMDTRKLQNDTNCKSINLENSVKAKSPNNELIKKEFGHSGYTNLTL